MATLSQVSLRQLILIGRKQEIGRREVFHLIDSLVSATLELKRTRGFPHGNLNAANVFVRDPRRISASEVVLQNPKPAESSDAQQNELSDLHNLGDILFKLVRHRDASAAESWPVPDGPEWPEMFGKDAEAWRDLCNRLVDPNLSLAQLSLEDLREKLKELRPPALRGRAAIVVVTATVAATLLVGFVVWRMGKRAKEFLVVELDSDPQSASIESHGTTLGKTPWKHEFKREEIQEDSIELKLTLKEYHDVSITLTNLKRSRIELKIPLQHYTETVEVNSDPKGADLFYVVGGKTNSLGRTPSTNRLDTGEYTFLARHFLMGEQMQSTSLVKDNPRTVRFTFEYGTLVVESTNAGATVWLGSQRLGLCPFTTNWPAGTTNIIVRAEQYNDEVVTISVTNRETTHRAIALSKGKGKVEITGLPPKTRVFDNHTNLLGNADANGRFPIERPVGIANLLVQKDWFYHRLPEVSVEKDKTNTLMSRVGFSKVVLDSNPRGAEILRDGILLTNESGRQIFTPFTNEYHDLGSFDYTVRKKVNADEEASWQERIAVSGLSPVIRSRELSSGSGYIRFNLDPPALSLRWRKDKDETPITSTIWRFPKGVREIVAEHVELGRVVTNIKVIPDQTNDVAIRIPHGGVLLQGEPPVVVAHRISENRTNASHTTPWTDLFLKPGRVDYRLVDPQNYFQDKPFATNVAAGVTNQLRYRLDRGFAKLNLNGSSNTEVWLQTNLPAAQFSSLGRIPANGVLEAKLAAGYTYALRASNQASHWTTNIALPPKIGDEIQLAVLFPPSVRPPIQTNLQTGTTPVATLLPGAKEIPLGGGAVLEFVWVPSARLHVGRYEVTQKQYKALMGENNNPSAFKGDDLPVNYISFNEAMQFCAALNTRYGSNGDFRLPTTVEWLNFAVDVTRLAPEKMSAAGIYNKGDAAGPERIGSLQANQYGLYDLRGNVSELCTDGAALYAVGHSYKDRYLPGPLLGRLFPGENVLNGSLKQPFYGFRVVLVSAGP